MISATLGLDISPFLENLNKVREKIEGLSKFATIFTASNLIGKEAFEGLSEGIEKIRGIVEMGGQLQDLSLNTGQSVHDLVILRQAFQNAGLGADAVGPMMAKFQKALSGVNEQGEPTNHALERLKLNVEGFREMPAIEQFRALQRAIEGVHDPVERTQLAMQLFGKSGAKMLAFLSEGEGLDVAQDQVGGLADTLEKSAEVFHQVSNAITTLGQKVQEVFVGFFSAILPGVNSSLQALTKIDLTHLGETIGQAAVQIGELVQELWKLKPLLEAIAIQFAFGLTGDRVFKSIQGAIDGFAMLQIKIGANGGALATLRGLFNQPVGGGLFNSIRNGLNGAMLETAAVTAAIAAITWAWNHYQERKAAVEHTEFANLDKDLHRQQIGNIEAYQGVTDEEGKGELVTRLEKQLEELHNRIAEVDHDYASLGSSSEADKERADIAKRLEQQAASVERVIEKTRAMTDEQMRAHDAMRISARAAEDQKKALEGLYEAQKKLTEEIAKGEFNELKPEEQKEKLLNEAGANSSSRIDDRITELQHDAENGRGYEGDIEKAQRLVEIRRQLIDVEKRIAQEKDKQWQKEAEAAKKAQEQLAGHNDFVRKESLEIQKLRAQASGDKKEEARVDRQQRQDRYFEEAKQHGLLDGDASRFARYKVDFEDAAKAEKEREKDSNEDKEDKVTVSADADRRVGLGGRAFADHSNPLLQAQRESTKSTTSLKGSIDKLTKQLESKPERVVMPSKAVFSR